MSKRSNFSTEINKISIVSVLNYHTRMAFAFWPPGSYVATIGKKDRQVGYSCTKEWWTEVVCRRWSYNDPGLWETTVNSACRWRHLMKNRCSGYLIYYSIRIYSCAVFIALLVVTGSQRMLVYIQGPEGQSLSAVSSALYIFSPPLFAFLLTKLKTQFGVSLLKI